MKPARFTTMTSSLIFVGTFLLSILSFVTTYAGMAILLHPVLAAIGALGLQASMLGIAWNILRIRGRRLAFVSAFTAAGLFSVFFSYANFNIALKQATRGQEVRDTYSTLAIPVLRQYGDIAKGALNSVDYQSRRIDDLVELEETKGWATVVDEGSGDPVVQRILDGARKTVTSWRQIQGEDYRQGAGKGIIANYLGSWQDLTLQNKAVLTAYVHQIDSLSAALTTAVSVDQQYQMVNSARMSFPQSEYAAITAGAVPSLPDPPFTAGYMETPLNGQQAFALVIEDLYPMDLLTLFAILLAIAVDFIVIILALAAGRLSHDSNMAFERAEKDALKRIRRASLDNPKSYQGVLDQNIARLRAATQYSQLFGQVLSENVKAHTRIKLIRGEEIAEKTPLNTVSDLRANIGELSSTDRLRRMTPRSNSQVEQEEFDSAL